MRPPVLDCNDCIVNSKYIENHADYKLELHCCVDRTVGSEVPGTREYPSVYGFDCVFFFVLDVDADASVKYHCGFS